MHTKKEFMRLSADFNECRDVLVALGDENRLHVIVLHASLPAKCIYLKRG